MKMQIVKKSLLLAVFWGRKLNKSLDSFLGSEEKCFNLVPFPPRKQSQRVSMCYIDNKTQLMILFIRRCYVCMHKSFQTIHVTCPSLVCSVRTWCSQTVIYIKQKQYRIYIIKNSFIFVSYLCVCAAAEHPVETQHIILQSKATIKYILFITQQSKVETGWGIKLSKSNDVIHSLYKE